ncbi:uncharacterized protein LOC123552333 [Mercenaria mercenaria]|uniref:uncharacterized protein LOC123552333 n=1 Tax=Mercenaria mercenaria TaxID=6596 RepID=UPI00234F46EF|nr:uncharacterized protein LOC123552333 [Mercenaria mercenaria]
MENTQDQEGMNNNEGEEKENATQTVQKELTETHNTESVKNTDEISASRTDESNSAYAVSVNIAEEQKTSNTKWRELDDLYTLLQEQALIYDNDKRAVESTRQTSKEKVNQLFEKVQQVLFEKKDELLSKIDTECNDAACFLADILRNIECDIQKMSDSDISCGEAAVEVLKKEIDTAFKIRLDTFSQFNQPKLVLNEKVVELVKGLSLGEFQGSTIDNTRLTELESSDNDSQESDTYESAPESEDYLNDGESSQNEAMIIEEGTGSADVEGLVEENKKDHDGATVSLGNAVSTPRGPRIKNEACPTPYWKAMGLSKPPEVPQPLNQTENGNLPDNKLEHLHSFSLNSLHGQQKLIPVAMTWNCGRICVADRANTKIGFFNQDGELITEMTIDSIELRDMTFLDETYGETRYVLTSPKSKTLMIIGIDVENSTRLILKLDSPHRYSFICRGPRPAALLGAKVVSKRNKSVIHMFTFSGQVLLSIANTPSYNQLQCVKGVDVFGSNIIVLDSKVNSVSVYQDDGRTVGEYRGTPELPLVNPLDMTLDNKGNIMVLNGEFSNIHVIDLHCNFIEVINLPSCKASSRKLIAFDIESQRLSVAKSNGDVAIFTFKNGYSCLTQRKPDPCLAVPHQNATNIWEQPQEVVPLVEGMVPSAIEDIMSRQRGRNRLRNTNSQYPS